uniref:Uncharacterized protein n=1 Tax=Oncorhynchus tshawytscha TaxID=74940 RepID=A0AAZ3SHK2_ONCTS
NTLCVNMSNLSHTTQQIHQMRNTVSYFPLPATQTSVGRPCQTSVGRPCQTSVGRPLGRPCQTSVGRPCQTSVGRPCQTSVGRPCHNTTTSCPHSQNDSGEKLWVQECSRPKEAW